MKYLMLLLLVSLGCGTDPILTCSKFTVIPFDGVIKIQSGETNTYTFKAGQATLYKNVTNEELKSKEVELHELIK